jgi:hypothetical protein
MRTDEQEKLRNSRSEVEEQQDETQDSNERKLDLSLSQVVGGALAAVTAAAVGSRLGATGTLIGAAVASVIAAVAGAIYTASLRHTHERVRTVWTGRLNAETPTAVEVISDRPEANAASAPPQRTGRLVGWRREVTELQLPWRSVAIGALVAFGVAAAAVTALELVSGQALSGDDGTTISQVSSPDRADPPTSTEDDDQSEQNQPTNASAPTESGQPAESSSSTPSTEETSAQQDEPSAEPTSAPRSSSSAPPAATPGGQPTG